MNGVADQAPYRLARRIADEPQQLPKPDEVAQRFVVKVMVAVDNNQVEHPVFVPNNFPWLATIRLAGKRQLTWPVEQRRRAGPEAGLS
jgi:hypothetical protein